MHDEPQQSGVDKLDRRTLLLSTIATLAVLPLSVGVAQPTQWRPSSDSGGAAFRQRILTATRHRTTYIEAGLITGPLMIFLHGDLGGGLIWRNQIEHFAEAGWHCVAPDMRGYGGSSAPDGPEDYALREIVRDMTDLHDLLGGAAAVWVGLDFGCPVVWQLAATEGQRCRAVVALNLPYFPAGVGLIDTVPHVDRKFSPLDRYLLGKRDYMQFYTESVVEAPRDNGGDGSERLAMLFGKSSIADRKHGLTGPNKWYRNEAANLAYMQEALNGGRLTFPVLYLHARYDVVVDTVNSRLAGPMRAACADLSEATFDACHCLPQERPDEVSDAIEKWLVATRLS